MGRRLKGWHERYYELKGTELVCYKDATVSSRGPRADLGGGGDVLCSVYIGVCVCVYALCVCVLCLCMCIYNVHKTAYVFCLVSSRVETSAQRNYRPVNCKSRTSGPFCLRCCFVSNPQCTRVGISRPSSYGFTFEIQAPDRTHVFVSSFALHIHRVEMMMSCQYTGQAVRSAEERDLWKKTITDLMAGSKT